MELTVNGLPVCTQQEHLLLSREYYENQGVKLSPNVVASVLHFKGLLICDLLTDSLNAVVARHSALRTLFARTADIVGTARRKAVDQFAKTGIFQPGLYRQQIRGSASVIIPIKNIVASEGGYEAQVVHEAIRREFDLLPFAGTSAVNATLFRVRPDEHFLLLLVDHLITDAWSMRILRSELLENYRRIAAGHPPLTENAPASYADYAVLQGELSDNGDFKSSLEYWTRQWRAFSSSRIGFDSFPISLPNPASPQFAFAAQQMRLPPLVAESIREYIRRNRITSFVFYLAAFFKLLRRYSGREKLAIWGHFANRGRLEFHNTIGWFATTHLLGIDLTPCSSPEDVFLLTRDCISDAAEHQELPTGLLWRSLGHYPRDPDARVLIDLSTEASAPSEIPGTGVVVRQARELLPVTGRFAVIGLYVRDTTTEIELSLQYQDERFPAFAMQQMLTDFQNELLEFIAA